MHGTHETHSPRRQTRLIQYDGLRGLAALSVVHTHLLQALLPAFYDPAPSLTHGYAEATLATTPIINLFGHGAAAITLFFVLSGFVLTLPTIKQPAWKSTIIRAAKRYPRLAIPMLASALFCVALSKSGFYWYGAIVEQTRSTMPDFYASPLTYAAAFEESLWSVFLGGSTDVNPVMWTMRVEFYGSLLCYVLALLRLKGISILWISAAVAWASGEAYYLGFGLGAMLAHSQRPGFAPHASSPRLEWVFFWVGALMLSLPYHWKDSVWSPLWSVFEFSNAAQGDKIVRMLGATLLLRAVAELDLLERQLSRKVPALLGRVSFGLYLIHFPLVFSLGAFIFMNVLASATYGIALVATFVLTVPACVVVAMALTELVDRPVTSWLDRAGYRVLGAWRRSDPP